MDVQVINQLKIITGSIKNLTREVVNTNTKLDRLVAAVDMLSEKMDKIR